MRGQSTAVGAGRAPFLTEEVKQNYIGTVRGRIGFLPADRLLIYVTGGGAYGEVNTSGSMATASNGGAPLNIVGANGNGAFGPTWAGNASTTRFGFAIGGGGEVAVTDHITIKGEFLYYDLGTVNSTLTGATPASAATGIIVNNSAPIAGGIARAGINFKF